jgi:hypothetical protein
LAQHFGKLGCFWRGFTTRFSLGFHLIPLYGCPLLYPPPFAESGQTREHSSAMLPPLAERPLTGEDSIEHPPPSSFLLEGGGQGRGLLSF